MEGSLALLFGSPASGVRSVHPDKRAEMFELPFAVYFDIIVLVAHGSPFGLILFPKGKRPQKIPGHLGLISIDVHNRIHNHVLRKANKLLEALEQLADGGMALRFPKVAAFPNAVFDEQGGDGVRIVVIITDRAIARFQFLDRFPVLDPCKPFFECL